MKFIKVKEWTWSTFPGKPFVIHTSLDTELWQVYIWRVKNCKEYYGDIYCKVIDIKEKKAKLTEVK